MKRLVPLFIAAALLLNACATDAPLWGEYATPTPAYPPEAASETTPTGTTPLDAPQIILTELAALSDPILLATTVAPQPTETPAPAVTETAAPAAQIVTPGAQGGQPILYYAQSGDTLAALSARFGVDRKEITSPKNLPETGLIDPGTLLIVPNRIEQETTSNVQVMPDSEIVFSATAADFNIPQFIANAGGHLSTYREYLGSTGWTTGAQAFTRLSYENSVNPRLMLALLEYESHWVYNVPSTANEEYPMGFVSLKYKGLFLQMVWTLNQLYAGYYGWRAGTLTELTFPNGETLRLHPELNAGTVAIQYFFSRLHNRAEWEGIVNPDSVNSFTGLYNQMFGDAWARAQSVEPLFPIGLAQPKFILPFEVNREWHLISGPHGAWEREGPLAAIDLAPSTDHGGCSETNSWVMSAAPGLVVRSGGGIVVVDLDGDGLEQTGWSLLYMHIATDGRVPAGVWVKADDHIGHASCEGGVSTGTHLHFARKYNGEWILADGPIPMVLGGWTVHAGMNPYEGTLTRGSRTVIADLFGQSWSTIIRLPDE
jgi:murein DD-endopeptidase MepM/ murein hydrolase activator NlpD